MIVPGGIEVTGARIVDVTFHGKQGAASCVGEQGTFDDDTTVSPVATMMHFDVTEHARRIVVMDRMVEWRDARTKLTVTIGDDIRIVDPTDHDLLILPRTRIDPT